MSAKVKRGKSSTIIFLVGVLLFLTGIVGTAIGYAISAPIDSWQVNGQVYAFPYLNWITIAGVIIAVVALASSSKTVRNHI